jgi:hypothetical protein
MKTLILFLMMNHFGLAQAGNEFDESKVILPKSNAYMKWDTSAIGVISQPRKDKPGKQYFLHLKGDILAKKVNSFSYQVNTGSAQKVTIVKHKHKIEKKPVKEVFELDVLIEELPSLIRLWMEVAEGRAIRLESYEVSVEPENAAAPNTKLINY